MLPIVEQALSLEKNGNASGALNLLFDEVKNNPNIPEIWAQMALISTRAQNFEITTKCLDILPNFGKSFKQANIPDVPQETIIFPVLGWFLNRHDLVYGTLAQKGVFPVVIPPDIGRLTPLPDLTPENLVGYTYKNINIYEASLYSAAIVREKSIAELNITADAEDLRVLTTQMQMLATYTDYCIRLIDYYRPRKIIYPQGYMPGSSVLRQLAILKNIPFLALENTMHKDKVLYDGFSGISVNLNTIRNHYWRNCQLTDAATATKFTDDYFADIQNIKQGEHKAPSAVLENKTGKKTAFFIGQVFTDASILFGIRSGFKNQADVIAAATKAALDRGHAVVIKLHPKEHNGVDPVLYRPYNQLTLRRLQSSPGFSPYLNHPDVIIDTYNTYNTYDMIDKADYCVTINSQAGLEALLCGKDVIQCGYSFYGGMEWTYDAHDAEDIGHCIDKIIASSAGRAETHKTEIQKFFYSYLNHACINRDLNSIINLFTKG